MLERLERSQLGMKVVAGEYSGAMGSAIRHVTSAVALDTVHRFRTAD